MSKPELENYLVVLCVVLAHSLISTIAMLLTYHVSKLKQFTARNFLLYTTLCFLPVANILMLVVAVCSKPFKEPEDAEQWEDRFNEKL
ncbi:MAG: hypothetical protein ACOVOV_17830 [Dolichospermum sp.]